MKITYIMPVYYNAGWIRRCLDSIYEFLGNDELIILYTTSEDNSWNELVDNLKKKNLILD